MDSNLVTGDKGTFLGGEEGPDGCRGLRHTQVEVPGNRWTHRGEQPLAIGSWATSGHTHPHCNHVPLG